MIMTQHKYMQNVLIKVEQKHQYNHYKVWLVNEYS